MALAHSLGAKYEMGYWKFPTPELKATFQRRVSGMEWTEQQRKVADDALKAQRDVLMTKKLIDMEPGTK
jgi:hypothetical protein